MAGWPSATWCPNQEPIASANCLLSPAGCWYGTTIVSFFLCLDMLACLNAQPCCPASCTYVQITCEGVDYVSCTYDPFLDLSLEINQVGSPDCICSAAGFRVGYSVLLFIYSICNGCC